MSEASASDQIAIRELLARYCDAVLRRDTGDWGATWAPDGAWNILGRVTRGREEVVKLWEQLMGGFSFVQQVPTHGFVEFDSADEAHGRWYISEYGQAANGNPSLTLGVYHDRYVRLDEGWRFARRRFDILYMGPPDFSGQTLPFPQNPEED